MSKGVPEITASLIGKQENLDINSVKKLNETTWYYERGYIGSKGIYKGTFNEAESMLLSYSSWVIDYNDGVDVLKKL